MARIEISLEEYNGLKDTISKLEQNNLENEKAIQEMNDVLTEMYDELYDLVNETGFLNRVFAWNKTTQNAQEILEKYEKK
jgi:hypothetical protein